MQLYKLAVSKEAPNIKDVVWAKPEGDSFSLYLLNNGKWCPLKCILSTEDTEIVEDMKKKLIGTPRDKKTAMTLYGLKAYINYALANLE